MPKNFGEAGAGKLKADEWRILATIYLPIALISMWGIDIPSSSTKSEKEEAQKFRRVLDHTMLLVSCIWLACARTMTEGRIQAYLSNMTEYVANLRSIHPNARFTSIHHIALHLPKFLRLFGPVRSWWCFPFERLIGQLQRTMSNHKMGT